MKCCSAFLFSQNIFGGVNKSNDYHNVHHQQKCISIMGTIATTNTAKLYCDKKERRSSLLLLRNRNGDSSAEQDTGTTTLRTTNVDWDNSMAMAKYTLQRVAAAILSVPPDVFSLSPPMMETPPASKEEELHRQAVSDILSKSWSTSLNTNIASDGFQLLPGEETSFFTTATSNTNDENDNIIENGDQDVKGDATSSRPGPSTYGEITELGARQLFQFMKLLNKDTTTTITTIDNSNRNSDGGAVTFFDLGSGTGKLVLQTYMELPRLTKAVGIELAPSRHEIAVQVYNELYHSSHKSLQAVRSMNPAILSRQQQDHENLVLHNNDDYDAIIELHQGDIFDFDLREATHIYISSLCFTREMMERLANKIIQNTKKKSSNNTSNQPSLECIATLQVSNTLEEKFGRPRMEWIEMSWTKARGQGCPVYFYDVKK